MRAARCESHGKPDAIVIRELPGPVAGTGEVVVGIEAASVNYPDVLIAADRYQLSVPTPFTAGSEFAGRVLSVGPEVVDLSPGDAVMGTSLSGAFAERITVSRSALSPVPAGLDMVHAAAFNVTYRTAYHALTTFGGRVRRLGSDPRRGRRCRERCYRHCDTSGRQGDCRSVDSRAGGGMSLVGGSGDDRLRR
ncbi:hypothetical protein GCM10020255_013260 [Rhodococcus baikonurensis]